MVIKDVYDSLGGSYETALSRLMNDRLIEKFALKFVNDPSYASLEDAMEKKDWAAAFSASHTLKGVALNLAFSVLAASASKLTDMFRPQNIASYNENDFVSAFETVKVDYANVINKLNEYAASKQ